MGWERKGKGIKGLKTALKLTAPFLLKADGSTELEVNKGAIFSGETSKSQAKQTWKGYAEKEGGQRWQSNVLS